MEQDNKKLNGFNNGRDLTEGVGGQPAPEPFSDGDEWIDSGKVDEKNKESHCKHLNSIIADLNKELEFKNNSIHTYKNQLSAKIDETSQLRETIYKQKIELDNYKRSIEIAQYGCPPYPARVNELINIITVEKTGFVGLEDFMEFGPHDGKTVDEVDLEMRSIEIKGLIKYIEELKYFINRLRLEGLSEEEIKEASSKYSESLDWQNIFEDGVNCAVELLIQKLGNKNIVPYKGNVIGNDVILSICEVEKEDYNTFWGDSLK